MTNTADLSPDDWVHGLPGFYDLSPEERLYAATTATVAEQRAAEQVVIDRIFAGLTGGL